MYCVMCLHEYMKCNNMQQSCSYAECLKIDHRVESIKMVDATRRVMQVRHGRLRLAGLGMQFLH